MERSLNHDKIYSAQLGFRINQPFDHDFMTHNLTLRGSSEVASNLIDNQYIKTKLFVRYLFAVRNVQFFTSLSGGFLKNLNKKAKSNFDDIRVNDTFYLKNFKGVRNIGYYYNEEEKQKGVGGDNLGLDRYL